MKAEVEAALAARKEPDPRDGGAAALALTYASLMDEAAPAGRYRRPLEVLARCVAGTGYEEDDPAEALHTVAQALAEHSVASDLGPKLLSVLAGLGLTVAARGAAKGEVQNSGASPLGRLKNERQLRIAGRSPG